MIATTRDREATMITLGCACRYPDDTAECSKPQSAGAWDGSTRAVVMRWPSRSLLTIPFTPPRPAPQSTIPAATSMPYQGPDRHPATATVIDHEG